LRRSGTSSTPRRSPSRAGRIETCCRSESCDITTVRAASVSCLHASPRMPLATCISAPTRPRAGLGASERVVPQGVWVLAGAMGTELIARWVAAPAATRRNPLRRAALQSVGALVPPRLPRRRRLGADHQLPSLTKPGLKPSPAVVGEPRSRRRAPFAASLAPGGARSRPRYPRSLPLGARALDRAPLGRWSAVTSPPNLVRGPFAAVACLAMAAATPDSNGLPLRRLSSTAPTPASADPLPATHDGSAGCRPRACRSFERDRRSL